MEENKIEKPVQPADKIYSGDSFISKCQSTNGIDDPKNSIFVLNISCGDAVRILGVLYLVSSLIHIQTLVVKKYWYFEIYGYMPLWLATLRYYFSWFQRFVAITGAIGLLMLHKIGRWIILGVSIFTIAGIYWKHPYTAFLSHTKGLDAQYGHLIRNEYGISFTSLALASTVLHVILGVGFCLAVIYFLTRPKIKRVFD